VEIDSIEKTTFALSRQMSEFSFDMIYGLEEGLELFKCFIMNAFNEKTGCRKIQ